MRLILANQATAAKRRVYFHLVGTDGLTPATSEAGGQPQISSDGGAFTNTGIGTLSAIGNGRYYADLTQAAVLTTGTLIETRFKSATTAECPGDSVQVVAFNPDDATALGLSTLTGNVPQTGDSYARIGANGAGLTAIPDSAGTTTLLSRIASALTITTGKVDVNDKTGFALSSTSITAIWAAVVDSSGVTTLLSRLTSTRAGLLDNLDAAVSGIPAAVWAVGTRTLTGFGTLVSDIWAAVTDSAGVTTLLGRLTALRAGYLDNLSSAPPTAAQNRAEMDSNSTQLAKLGTPAGASMSADIAAVKTDSGNLLTNIATLAGKFTGITLLAKWLQALARKDTPDTTAAAEIGGTYDATTDSLQALRDRGDAAWTSSEIANVTLTLTQVAAAMANSVADTGALTIRQGDSFSGQLTGLGSLVGRTRLYLTIKSDVGIEDSQALVQVEETDGLLYLNGEATTHSTWGTLTVDDAAAGDVTLTLTAAATALLEAIPNAYYDIKMVTEENVTAVTRTQSTAVITSAITQSTA